MTEKNKKKDLNKEITQEDFLKWNYAEQERVPRHIEEAQVYLIAYLFRLMGKSSREVERFHPDLPKHNVINERMRKGEEFYNHMNFLFEQINEILSIKMNEALEKKDYKKFLKIAPDSFKRRLQMAIEWGYYEGVNKNEGEEVGK